MRFQDLGKRGVLQNLDPSIILEDPGWNERKDGPALDAHIATLMGSIKAQGVLEPLTVYMRGDEVVLTNGHCRLLAVKRLQAEGEQIEFVPCRVEPKTANDAERVLSMLTRNSGKPLEPLEMAAVMKRLLAFGWDEAKIAANTGFTTVYVAALLKLNSAPEEIKGMITRGEVAATTAAKVIKAQGDSAAEVLREAVKDAKASGKKKATAKNLPAQPLTERAMKKRIKELEAAIKEVLASEAFYDGDAPELAEKLKALVQK